jgi:hypothetical protein
MRLVQLEHSGKGRRVAVVEGNRLRLIDATCRSTYEVAIRAIDRSVGLPKLVADLRSSEQEPYDEIWEGRSEWRLLPAFDHPSEAARCLVSGTGLTHRLSAQARQKIHQAGAPDPVDVTDSMRIYQWGLEGGRPETGEIGVQPEWFYKGCGTILRAHGEPLEVPAFADDGGEEAEAAAAYVIAPDGTPRRVGLMPGNEFSDHVMEAKNYLYLAPSKLRCCAVGPELVIDPDFQNVRGSVRIERQGHTIWERAIATGEDNMCHSLANLEHHHFKYPAHRRPGDVHIHFLGANVVSFGEKLALSDGDAMIIELEGFGRPLRNTLAVERAEQKLIEVEPLK